MANYQSVHSGSYIDYVISNSLLQVDAASTYLSQTSAASIYLTQADATSTYLSKTDAAATYLTQTDAEATYPTKTGGGGASGTWAINISGDATKARYLSSPDTRNTNPLPETFSSSLGISFDFKANSTIAIPATTTSTTYSGVMTYRPYGSSTDWSGGYAHQIAFNNDSLLWRTGGSSWNTWNEILTVPNSVTTTSADLNSYTKTGIYAVGATTNYATSSGNHGILFVFWNVGTPFQVFWGDSSIAKPRKRYYSGGTWSAWMDF